MLRYFSYDNTWKQTQTVVKKPSKTLVKMFLYPSLLPGKDGFTGLNKEYQAHILEWVVLYKVIISIEHSRGFLANFLSVSHTALYKSKFCIILISKLIEKGHFLYHFWNLKKRYEIFVMKILIFVCFVQKTGQGY